MREKRLVLRAQQEQRQGSQERKDPTCKDAATALGTLLLQLSCLHHDSPITRPAVKPGWTIIAMTKVGLAASAPAGPVSHGPLLGARAEFELSAVLTSRNHP